MKKQTSKLTSPLFEKPLFHKTATPLLAGLLIASSSLFISGCWDDDYNRPPSHRSVYYDPYDYYYYPRTQVYFHISSGYYYYRDGRHWRHVRRLPPRFHLNHKDRVRIIIRDEKPYIRHHEHIKVFTPHHHDKRRNEHYKRDKKREKYERKIQKQHEKEYRRERRHYR